MERTEIIGMISGLMVVFGASSYFYRTWQGKIIPNIVTWLLFSFIELSILINYRAVGASDNLWPAVFTLLDSLLITTIIIAKYGRKIKLKRFDYFCFALGFISLVLWWCWRENPAYAQYSLYAAMLADVAAGIATLNSDHSNPDEDRPFMWLIFAAAYGLDMLAIKKHDIANYSLPIYMCLGAIIIAIPLIRYRIKMKIPLREWI
ncbi:MAG: hypothetical protein WCK37_03725 [Candidatus Falkowbacteria bacterium]